MSAPAQAFKIKQYDQLPTLRGYLQNSAGDPVDLTGASSVIFNMRASGGTALLIATAAAVIATVTADVEYAWGASALPTAGWFEGEFQVTYSSGKPLTIPNDGFIPIHVGSQIG